MLIDATTVSEIKRQMPILNRIYAANALAMDEFKNSTKLGEMEAVVRKAHRTPDITPTVLKALTSHLAFWSTDKRCRSLLD